MQSWTSDLAGSFKTVEKVQEARAVAAGFTLPNGFSWHFLHQQPANNTWMRILRSAFGFGLGVIVGLGSPLWVKGLSILGRNVVVTLPVLASGLARAFGKDALADILSPLGGGVVAGSALGLLKDLEQLPGQAYRVGRAIFGGMAGGFMSVAPSGLFVGWGGPGIGALP